MRLWILLLAIVGMVSTLPPEIAEIKNGLQYATGKLLFIINETFNYLINISEKKSNNLCKV